jgi:hypothetical protein
VNNVASLKVRAYGYGGNDYLQGHNGNDILIGGRGIDTLLGLGGNDELWGDDHFKINDGEDDKIYGGAGNDLLHGGGGHDGLYGGSGADQLYGDAGNDGLFGGIDNSKDTLTGGTGADRFWQEPDTSRGVNKPYYANDWDKFWGIKTPRIVVQWYNEDPISDLAKVDAIIRYTDAPSMTNHLGDSFAKGTWTNTEIQAVDAALASLQKSAGSTGVLKTAAKGVIEFRRIGAGQSDAAAWNEGGTRISLTNSVFSGSSAALRDIVYHELGHNFPVPTSAIWSQFLAVSGWIWNPPTSIRAGMYVGANFDGGFGVNNGWYRKSNDKYEFASAYGGTNPFEDWATVWEHYFTHGKSTTASNDKLEQKLKFVERLVRTV